MSQSSGGGRREVGGGVPGGKLHHRRVRHYDCRGKDPLVLRIVSFETVDSAANLHLLKLVTGVEISTRAVKRSGSPGNEVKRRSLTAAAAPKITAFLLSTFILKITKEQKNEAQS